MFNKFHCCMYVNTCMCMMCVCVCVCVRALVCVRACVCACMCSYLGLAFRGVIQSYEAMRVKTRTAVKMLK